MPSHETNIGNNERPLFVEEEKLERHLPKIDIVTFADTCLEFCRFLILNFTIYKFSLNLTFRYNSSEIVTPTPDERFPNFDQPTQRGE